ncbi:MAG: 5'-3' exonuclease H3TH domain-containing protein [Gemmatimonadales bacterium]
MSLGRTSLFLIDGYALIYRAFFAMISRPLTTSKGENTSAVWGVANFLVRLVREHQPEYVAWIHDAGSSFRKDIYPEYKATREKLDEELQEQFDQSLTRIESLLEAFGVSLVAVPGYEADDVIGTLAARASEEGRSVVIVSGDKDFYQLINQHVSLLNPGRRGPSAVAETWVTPENAGERLGVEPEQVVDYLALVGDSSDNVPGVKGVGAKTATALIGEYGDLDSILAHASKIKGKRAREALENGGEHALLSRDLVTIKRDVPVDIELDQLRRRKPNARRLSQIFSELEFHSLIPQITAASSDAEPQPAESTAPAEAPIVEIVGDAGQVAAAVAALKQLDQFAIKVVSSDVNPHRGHLVGFCISPPVGAAYYFPIAHSDGMNLILEEPSLDPVRELLADSGIGKIGHDVKREWLALRKAGVDLGGASYDLLLASFIADPGSPEELV